MSKKESGKERKLTRFYRRLAYAQKETYAGVELKALCLIHEYIKRTEILFCKNYFTTMS